jgi:hypothetical protein
MQQDKNYNESDFVEYAFTQMGIKILSREDNIFELERGFSVEVENTDLYRLSSEGWVISPFDDMGKMCEFIKKNLEIPLHNE